jgi:hypothetical protein
MFEPLNHDRLIRSKHRLAAATRVALKKLRQQQTDDPGFQRLVRATRKPGARAATDTDAVTRSLAATFFPDLRREITLTTRAWRRRSPDGATVSSDSSPTWRAASGRDAPPVGRSVVTISPRRCSA